MFLLIRLTSILLIAIFLTPPIFCQLRRTSSHSLDERSGFRFSLVWNNYLVKIQLFSVFAKMDRLLKSILKSYLYYSLITGNFSREILFFYTV